MLKEQLKYCLLKYPSVFENRWSVYHHLFLVTGSGYEWVDGELSCSDFDPNYELVDAIKDLEEKYNKDIIDNEDQEKCIRPLLMSGIKKRFKKKYELLLDIDNRMVDLGQENSNRLHYPISGFSKLFNQPSDIKDDWREACEECLNYLIDNYDNLSDHNKKIIKPFLREKRFRKLLNINKDVSI